MPRYQPIAPDQLNSEQQRVYNDIVSGPRSAVAAPLHMWLHRPKFANYAQQLGAYARYDTLLPPRLSELAILITAQYWDSEFEWAYHKPIALECGVSAGVIESIRDRCEPEFDAPDEQLIYLFSQHLQRDHVVPDEIYNRALACFGLPAVVDLVGLIGYYTLIAMTIKAFDIPRGDGQPPELQAV